jgi:hypothetical protein
VERGGADNMSQFTVYGETGNPRGLVVYSREGISKRVTEIVTNMKEIIWVGVRKKRHSKIEICIGFVYNAPQTS